VYGDNSVRRYAGGSTTVLAGDTAYRILARLTKAFAIIASRACRSSVMISTPLSESEMERIVQCLGDSENPWHCAHGRTTVNHVGDVSQLMARDERKASAHVARSTVTVMSQMDCRDEDYSPK
jgi:DNA mismatch repair protein PMS2